MIILKNNLRLFLKTVLISVVCCAIFVGVGYFYLNSKISKPAKTKVENEPYSFPMQNVGIMFSIEDAKTFVYLDFSEKSVKVIMPYSLKENDYPIDFTVDSNYSLLSGIIDIIGGIELTEDNNLIYTGIQVVEILTDSPDDNELKREIVEKILSKISKRGFSRQDFLYITENSKTNLTVPKFYYWQDSISEICQNVIIYD